MGRLILYLAWAWEILIGVLLITPGGVFCIACGQVVNAPGYIGKTAVMAVGVISILFGLLGFAGVGKSRAASGAAAR